MRPIRSVVLAAACLLVVAGAAFVRATSSVAVPGQASAVTDGKLIYEQIRAFELTGGSADVENLKIRRDRVEMVFTGTFYFAAPVGGRVIGAVFTGTGTMRAEAPPSDFEFKLPAAPKKIELDPFSWVLSEKTVTRAK